MTNDILFLFQLNLPTAAEANEQLALTQEVLDAVRSKFGEEARILNNQAGQAAATLGQRPLAADTPRIPKKTAENQRGWIHRNLGVAID